MIRFMNLSFGQSFREREKLLFSNFFLFLTLPFLIVHQNTPYTRANWGAFARMCAAENPPTCELTAELLKLRDPGAGSRPIRP